MWFIFAMLAALNTAFNTIFLKITTATVRPLVIVILQNAIAFSILSIGLLFTHGKPILSTFTKSNTSFILLAGLSNALTWICYITALKYAPATRVVSVERLNIVMIIFFAWIFLKEPLKITSVIGGSLIATGACLIMI